MKNKSYGFGVVEVILLLLVTGMLLGLVWYVHGANKSAPAIESTQSTQSDPLAAQPFRALIFSKTKGYRHDAIPIGVEAIKALGAKNNFELDVTEDATYFNDETLQKYEVVIWLLTSGDVLDDSQQAAFEKYIRDGGGYVGVHAASDTEYDWSWYGGLVGAYFQQHPAPQNANVIVEDANHASTKQLPSTWNRYDEWYSFKTNPRGSVRVLLTLDEGSYSGGNMGADHPIAWCHNYAGGRAWYTALGHTESSYAEQNFQNHLLGGILSVAGAVKSDCAI